MLFTTASAGVLSKCPKQELTLESTIKVLGKVSHLTLQALGKDSHPSVEVIGKD